MTDILRVCRCLGNYRDCYRYYGLYDVVTR